MPVRQGYDPLEGILLLWEWEKPEGRNGRWVHRDTVADDGRGCADNWMRTSQTEEDYYDPKPVMGRMVTGWNVADGVGIVDITPPAWSDHIVDSVFVECLRKDREWIRTIQDGWRIHSTTVDVVRDLLRSNRHA